MFIMISRLSINLFLAAVYPNSLAALLANAAAEELFNFGTEVCGLASLFYSRNFIFKIELMIFVQ